MSQEQLLQGVLAAIAVILAALLAAMLANYGNVKIKQLEIQAQAERDKANKRIKFYLPLLRFCYTLDRRIGHILKELHSDWLSKKYLDNIQSNQGFAVNPNEKGYFIASSMYVFACFFGWSEAIKKGVDVTKPFSRSPIRKFLSKIKKRVYTFLRITDRRNIFIFDPDISIVFKLFQYEELFKEYLVSKTLADPRDASKMHKQFQFSIGELMLEKEGEDSFRCKSFREFFEAYVNDEKFRYWFTPLENLFIDLCGFPAGKDLETQVIMKNDVRPLRLVAIRYWCRVLMRNMSEELGIETPPPDEALEGISQQLKRIIKSVEIEKLESYLLGVRFDNE